MSIFARLYGKIDNLSSFTKKLDLGEAPNVASGAFDAAGASRFAEPGGAADIAEAAGEAASDSSSVLGELGEFIQEVGGSYLENQGPSHVKDALEGDLLGDGPYEDGAAAFDGHDPDLYAEDFGAFDPQAFSEPTIPDAELDIFEMAGDVFEGAESGFELLIELFF